MNVCFDLQICVEFNPVIDCQRGHEYICVFDLQIFMEFISVIDCQKDHECMCVWFADLCGVQLSD